MIKSDFEYFLSKILKKMRGRAIKNSSIHKTSKVEAGSTVVNSRFSRHSFCGYDCTIIDCVIGSFCSIANGVIIGGSRHPMEYVSTSPVFLSHKDSVKTKYSKHQYSGSALTQIGNDVWIGSRALIRGGVDVGHGAVIGMGSVVTKDIPPYAIAAGNPAKVIRKRFNEKTINILLELKWWNLPDKELKIIAQYFNDLEKFLEFLEKK